MSLDILQYKRISRRAYYKAKKTLSSDNEWYPEKRLKKDYPKIGSKSPKTKDNFVYLLERRIGRNCLRKDWYQLYDSTPMASLWDFCTLYPEEVESFMQQWLNPNLIK